MKTLTYFLLYGALLLLTTQVHAQEGTVTYEQVVKVDIDLPPEMEHMRDEIPNARTSKKVLYFNESASLMKDVAEEEGDQPEDMHFHGEGRMIRFRVGSSDNSMYVDLDEGRRVEKRDFMGRTFLITDEIEALPWRLTDERSEFLGYMCRKAVAEKDSTTYEAWFTPEISVPAGPGVGGLPGLIMVLNIDDGQRTLVAKELTLASVEDGLIAAPEKGRKVTQEEFDTIVAEKMEEMGATSNGRGNFIIRMRH